MDIQYAMYDSEILSSERCSDEYIKYNSCGWGIYPRNIHVKRPKGRLDYQLAYVAKGSAIFNDKILSEGDMYIFRPGEPQEIISLEENYTHYWIHFTGKAADTLFKHTTYTLIKSSYCEQFKKFCKENVRLRSIPNKSYYDDMITEGNLLTLITSIAKEQDNSTCISDKRVEKIIKYICDNPTISLTNQQYADMVNMSKYYFIRKFVTITGTSPQKYRLNILLEKSLLLLEDTSLRINEIAFSLGFDDSLYFSRLFKKQYGVSPSKYRK